MGGSIWRDIPMPPGDPIIAVIEAWWADTCPDKLNLGMGVYRTEEDQPLLLNVVRKAEAALLADPSATKDYLPITGDPVFCRLAREMAFGAAHAAITEGRVVTAQGVSGAGSLRVGAAFLASHYPVKRVLLPAQTWPTHLSIFTQAGMQVDTYRYFEPASRGLDIQGLLSDLSAAEEGSVVVLHACAHNPTGVDPTPEQWRSILEVVRRRRLFPFFDSAYQGFASGDLDADAVAIRLFASATTCEGEPLEMMLAQSFSKNMGLYGERVGALSIVTSQADVVSRIQEQIKMVIRPMYGHPPCHGSEVVKRVLGDPELVSEWHVELKGMADSIKGRRAALLKALQRRGVPGDWSFVTQQIGMFTYTGLTRAQCMYLRTKYHIYMQLDGRISMAGLNAVTADRLADGIVDALAVLPADTTPATTATTTTQPQPNTIGAKGTQDVTHPAAGTVGEEDLTTSDSRVTDQHTVSEHVSTR